MSLCAYCSFAPAGHADLLLHQIKAGDHFGHRMLDLQPRVHFDEIEFAILIEKLDRADPLIGKVGHGLGNARPDLVALGRVQGRGMGFFPDLLMPALQRAIALAQMHRIALPVAQHLDFNMPRHHQIFLDIDFFIAEGRLGFGLRRAQGIFHLGIIAGNLHAAPAAAGRCLDDDRIADLAGNALALIDI